MWLIDITKLLGYPEGFEYKNFYMFNPSIIAIPNYDNLYLVSYRTCYYDVSVQVHPWKIWDNSYKYFMDPTLVMNLKYRNTMGDAIQCSFDAPFDFHGLPEYDSTNFVVLEFKENNFHVKHRIYNPFGKEMNQDARLVVLDGIVYVSYNVFEKYNRQSKSPQTKCKLRYRTISLHVQEQYLTMSRENYMFHHKYNDIEKNCVFYKDKLIYSINDTFDYIVHQNTLQQKLVKKDCLYSSIIEYYGGLKHMHISSSTPIIKYGSKWVGCSHIKVVYKKLDPDNPFRQYLKTLDNIKFHGKYIYLASFYEFNDDMEITRVSNPFIPSYFANHQPYLLCMPTGLMWFQDKILLSYGEGDCKCKFLILRPDELESLLSQPIDYKLHLLTQQVQLQHVGYFGLFNAGDDAFKYVFEYLKEKYYPSFNLVFNKPKECLLDKPTIIGGGDVVNDYFMKHVPANSIAVGVGIPYKEFEPLIHNVKSVILRNKKDADRLNLMYFPDIAFLLDFKQSIQKLSRVIGISVMRTYYHPSYTQPYYDYIQRMSMFIQRLIDDSFSVVLIPFCINHNKIKEDDQLACKDILNTVQHNHCTMLNIEDTKDYVRTIYTQVASVDFMICARFHSHIFSTLTTTPFLSLTCGRKCIEYMYQENIQDCLYQLKTTRWDLPDPIHVDALYHFFTIKYAEKEFIRDRLQRIKENNIQEMKRFEQVYVSLVKQLVDKDGNKNSKMILYPMEYKTIQPEQIKTSNSTNEPDASSIDTPIDTPSDTLDATSNSHDNNTIQPIMAPVMMVPSQSIHYQIMDPMMVPVQRYIAQPLYYIQPMVQSSIQQSVRPPVHYVPQQQVISQTIQPPIQHSVQPSVQPLVQAPIQYVHPSTYQLIQPPVHYVYPSTSTPAQSPVPQHVPQLQSPIIQSIQVIQVPVMQIVSQGSPVQPIHTSTLDPTHTAKESSISN